MFYLCVFTQVLSRMYVLLVERCLHKLAILKNMNAFAHALSRIKLHVCNVYDVHGVCAMHGIHQVAPWQHICTGDLVHSVSLAECRPGWLLSPHDRGNGYAIRSAGDITDVPSWVTIDVRNCVSQIHRVGTIV